MKINVKCLGRGSKSCVKILAGGLAVFDGLPAGLHLALAGAHVGYISYGAGFLVLEIVQALFGNWGFTDEIADAVRSPLDRHRAHTDIAIFDKWIERVPELLLQIMHELETWLDERQTFLFDVGFRKPRGKLQVFAFGGQGFARQLNDQIEVGLLDLAFPGPARKAFVIFGPRFFDLVVDLVVAEIGSGGIITRNRVQQVIT